MASVLRSEGKFKNLVLNFNRIPNGLWERNIESEIEIGELIC